MSSERGAVLALLLVAACSAAAPPSLPSIADRGHLVLVGGGRKPEDAVRLFVRLAGNDRGPIVVLPLASEDSRAAGDEAIDLFTRHGAREVRVLHVDDRRDAFRRSFADAVAHAGGVWFSGGDQSRIAARIVDTPLHDALRAMKARGGVVGGTSAGTACQSHVMLTGAGGDERVVRRGNIPLSTGLGLFEGVVVDSHFVVRRRSTRLINVVVEHPSLLGVGIDEATAAWVRPDGTLQVVGESRVLVFDLSHGHVEARPDGTLDPKDLVETQLAPGQIFDLGKRVVLE